MLHRADTKVNNLYPQGEGICKICEYEDPSYNLISVRRVSRMGNCVPIGIGGRICPKGSEEIECSPCNKN